MYGWSPRSGCSRSRCGRSRKGDYTIPHKLIVGKHSYHYPVAMVTPSQTCSEFDNMKFEKARKGGPKSLQVEQVLWVLCLEWVNCVVGLLVCTINITLTLCGVEKFHSQEEEEREEHSL